MFPRLLLRIDAFTPDRSPRTFASARRKPALHRWIIWPLWFAVVVVSAATPAGQVEHRRIEVINAGVGGDATADVLSRIERHVGGGPEELVVLLVGTNDRLNSRKAVELDSFERNLERLAEWIQATGASLFLVTIPPAYEPYLLERHPPEFFAKESVAQRVMEANRVIRRVAADHALVLVDLHGAIEAAGGASDEPESLLRNRANSDSADGVHLTPAGCEILAQCVLAAIREAELPALRRVVCLGDSLTLGAHLEGEGTTSGETYPARLAEALNAHADALLATTTANLH